MMSSQSCLHSPNWNSRKPPRLRLTFWENPWPRLVLFGVGSLLSGGLNFFERLAMVCYGFVGYDPFCPKKHQRSDPHLDSFPPMTRQRGPMMTTTSTPCVSSHMKPALMSQAWFDFHLWNCFQHVLQSKLLDDLRIWNKIIFRTEKHVKSQESQRVSTCFFQVLHHRVAPVYAPHTPHVPHPAAGFPMEHGWWSETVWKRQLDVIIYIWSWSLLIHKHGSSHIFTPVAPFSLQILAKDGDCTSPGQGVGGEQCWHPGCHGQTSLCGKNARGRSWYLMVHPEVWSNACTLYILFIYNIFI